MSILMQAKVGSSCPPLCRGKRPWVSSPLLLTCRGGWVGWEPRGGTGAVRPLVSHGCSPWTEMEGSLCPCAHVFFSAALPKEVLAISSPALQDEPSATSRRPSAKHAAWGCTRGMQAELCGRRLPLFLGREQWTVSVSEAGTVFGRESLNQNKFLIETRSIPTICGFL